MLATEPTTAQTSAHETWSRNERMRHIPLLSWMIQKLDGDVRRRFDTLFAPIANLETSSPHHAPLEVALRAFCRSLDRVADVARRSRGQSHPPTELGARIHWALNHALGNLSAIDPETFGKRFPFQTFERSNAEPLTAAMFSALHHLQRLQDLVRAVDPSVDERIYADLVTLIEPMRPEPMA